MWSMGWLGQDEVANTEELSWSSQLLFWFTNGAKWFTSMLFEFVVITLFSPIMAMLSEHIETSIRGNEFQFSFARFISELLRTIGILISGFVFSFFVVLIWNLIAWIGDLSLFTPYIVFVIKAFFIGFNFMDYSLERNFVSVGKSWQYALRQPLIMLIVGAVFSAIFSIPILGVFLAPFLATVLATVIWLSAVPEKN
jgi:CysZ protein